MKTGKRKANGIGQNSSNNVGASINVNKMQSGLINGNSQINGHKYNKMQSE